MTEDKQFVSVIGLGAMGRALAGALLRAGHPTTVWNRTPEKADEIEARGARHAATPGEAIATADVTILCLLDYDVAREVLARSADALDGRLIVNLTNGSPADARALEEWVEERGAQYLDGGIMAVPQTIATPGAFILCAGADAAFVRAETTIAVFGRADHVGRDTGLAPLYDMALLSGLYGIYAGAQHAVLMIASEGGDVEAFKQSLLGPWIEAMLPFTASEVNAESYVPEEFNAAMQAASLENLIAASAAQGIAEDRGGHLEASLTLMRTSIAAASA